MNIFFKEAYWGALIILAGVLLIARNIFKIDIPVWGIIFPIIIISIGISILAGGRGGPEGSKAVFTESSMTADSSDSEYSIVFGKGEYDLRRIKPVDKNISVEINAVFSSAVVRIDPTTPMRIKIESAFAGGHSPGGHIASIGDNSYRTPAYKEGAPFVDVRASVVFGSLRIVEDTVTSF
jgi:hypothetical protein